jgi:hypothetical protein
VAQIKKRGVWLRQIRQMLDEQRLAFHPLGTAGAMRAIKGIDYRLPLTALDLVHRPVYAPSSESVFEHLDAVGAGHARKALEQAELRHERERFIAAMARAGR